MEQSIFKQLRDVAASVMAQMPNLYAFNVASLLRAMNVKPKTRAEARNIMAALLNCQVNVTTKLNTLIAA